MEVFNKEFITAKVPTPGIPKNAEKESVKRKKKII